MRQVFTDNYYLGVESCTADKVKRDLIRFSNMMKIKSVICRWQYKLGISHENTVKEKVLAKICLL